MPTITERLERIVEVVTPFGFDRSRLLPGLTDDEIAAIETRTGLILPDSWKELVRWSAGDPSYHWQIFHGDFFRSPEEVKQLWEYYAHCNDEYRRREWFPFLGEDDYNFCVIGGDRPAADSPIIYATESSDGFVFAPSLDAFLAAIEENWVTENYDGYLGANYHGEPALRVGGIVSERREAEIWAKYGVGFPDDN